jgi:3-hydroxyisobutyrate dehydrogenase
MKIGYIGVGNMGGALAARLAPVHPLIVHDRSTEAVERMRQVGAQEGTLALIAAECRAIFLCLPTSNEVRQVLLGPDGLSSSLTPGTLIIDQTTGDPNETRRMAQELAIRNVELIDAPVSGGIAGAQTGTIAIMVGAEQSQFDRALPLLKVISSNVFHAGGVGNGHVIKLVNNLLSTAQRILSFEAIALAAKNGVDPKMATQILLAGGGRNAYLEKMMAPRILSGKLDVGFTLGLAHKDVRLACQMGSDSGVPMFFGNLTRELYQVAIAEKGARGQVDTVGQVYDRLAGTQVVPLKTDLREA